MHLKAATLHTLCRKVSFDTVGLPNKHATDCTAPLGKSSGLCSHIAQVIFLSQLNPLYSRERIICILSVQMEKNPQNVEIIQKLVESQGLPFSQSGRQGLG